VPHKLLAVLAVVVAMPALPEREVQLAVPGLEDRLVIRVTLARPGQLTSFQSLSRLWTISLRQLRLSKVEAEQTANCYQNQCHDEWRKTYSRC
jgi:hypothetical protein